MKNNTVQLLITAMVLTGVSPIQAAPWLGLVRTGTSSQTNATIAIGTSTFSMDLRANTDTHPVGALQYSISTSAGAVTYGASPLTALNNPFSSTDLTGFGQAPSAGSAVDNSNWTVWWKGSGDYAAFAEQAIGTYQFNVSSLSAGTYVFAFANQELLNNSPGEDITTFAPYGAFVLDVTAVPEPGSWALLIGGGLMAIRRNRRRHDTL